MGSILFLLPCSIIRVVIQYLVLCRELLRTQSAIAWPLTPPKKHSASKCHVLIEQELSEDSSDEEYQPNDEEYQPNDEEPEQVLICLNYIYIYIYIGL